MPHVNEVIYGVCSVVIWAIGARSAKTPDAMEQITVMYCSCAAKDGRRVESSKELVGSQNPASVARGPGTLSNDGSALDQ